MQASDQGLCALRWAHVRHRCWSVAPPVAPPRGSVGPPITIAELPKRGTMPWRNNPEGSARPPPPPPPTATSKWLRRTPTATCRIDHAFPLAVPEVECRRWQLLEEFSNATCVVISVNVEVADRHAQFFQCLTEVRTRRFARQFRRLRSGRPRQLPESHEIEITRPKSATDPPNETSGNDPSHWAAPAGQFRTYRSADRRAGPER